VKRHATRRGNKITAEKKTPPTNGFRGISTGGTGENGKEKEGDLCVEVQTGEGGGGWSLVGSGQPGKFAGTQTEKKKTLSEKISAEGGRGEGPPVKKGPRLQRERRGGDVHYSSEDRTRHKGKKRLRVKDGPGGEVFPHQKTLLGEDRFLAHLVYVQKTSLQNREGSAYGAGHLKGATSPRHPGGTFVERRLAIKE